MSFCTWVRLPRLGGSAPDRPAELRSLQSTVRGGGQWQARGPRPEPELCVEPTTCERAHRFMICPELHVTPCHGLTVVLPQKSVPFRSAQLSGFPPQAA